MPAIERLDPGRGWPFAFYLLLEPLRAVKVNSGCEA